MTWEQIELPSGGELWRKELYHYRIRGNDYEIELFCSQDGAYYAIGTPADKERLVIYGSQVVGSPALALKQALKKINRDELTLPIDQVGEDVD